MRKSGFYRFVFYACMGALGTVGQYLVLIALVSYRVSGPVLASSIGMLVGACINYALNYRFTFRSNAGHHRVAPRFFLIASVGLGLNAAAMALLTPLLPYLAAQVLTTCTVLLLTYTANSVWAFKS